MKKIIMQAGIVVLCTALHLSPFTQVHAGENYYSYSRDHQGYTMAESHDPDHIIVAGSICQTPLDCKILVQETDKATGAVIWSTEYNWNIGSERCFNIIKTGSGYLLTGYAYDGPTQVTYVMSINTTGGINWVKKYHKDNSVGLYALECSDGTGYVVAGYMADRPGSGANTRTGYIMKIDPAGNILWNTLYDSPKAGQDYDMAEHVIEVPGTAVPGANTSLCYYVTGSVNFTYTDPWNNTVHYQKVLSLMLNDSGAVAWQNAFTTGTPPSVSGYSPYTEVGVSSVYDAMRNEIFLVSNAENAHGFFVSTINPGSGNVLAHRSVHDSTLATSCKLSAYQVHDKDANTISVAGFIHKYDWSSSTPHNPTFAVDIDKNTLLGSTIHVFEISSTGHNVYFADWLGTPASTGFPTIHTPDMSLVTGNDFWTVCYYNNAPNYDLAIQHMAYSNYADACNPATYTPDGDDAGVIQILLLFDTDNIYSPVTFSDNSLNPSVNDCVPVVSSKALAVSAVAATQGLSVYPSPADEILHISCASIQQVHITDITGRRAIIRQQASGVYDISSLSPGVYIVEVITDDNRILKERFVKQ